MRKILPILVLLGLALAVGYELGRLRAVVSFRNWKPAVVVNKSVPATAQISEADFGKFWMVWDKVSSLYVDKSVLDSGKMIDGAISGMVASLGDPYTAYLTAEQNKASNDSLEGQFEGVGIQLGYKEKQLAVVAALDGTPAKRAGVRAGDLIVRVVDKAKKVDRDTAGITLPEAVALIRGKKDTNVQLTLVREGVDKPIVLEIGRDTIKVKSVELTWLGTNKDVAWVKLTRFGKETQQEWDEAIEGIKAQDSRLGGVVLDLRNNPGGYLEASVYTSGEFFKKGRLIVTQQFGDGTKHENKTDRDGKLVDADLLVLVNEGSASAAEIMAGALQDWKRAKVVGVKTFGKGSVQQPESFADGSGLHTTIAKWLTPKGEWIDKNGIEPDVLIEQPDKEILDPSEDVQLQKALELL